MISKSYTSQNENREENRNNIKADNLNSDPEKPGDKIVGSIARIMQCKNYLSSIVTKIAIPTFGTYQDRRRKNVEHNQVAKLTGSCNGWPFPHVMWLRTLMQQ